ncbi:MAG: hypothetical protein UY55_C0001G0191 [Candidatus Jorgensenbacteria bacterium GW2011_GWB1_50_10]|uniref:DUF378 domain-containing protein n=1 Tax=Candidatus Jorgensenbacteria bacterium GW2011_GWB1_50_10 TaxID=1618665 RepID=A0A0G1YK92_9BACT|nr:MAG: hypothetical protein UY55_C0001G0191 [Candidatus Jorgensenbacteria bacterium GW2011_GWB1_50_10]
MKALHKVAFVLLVIGGLNWLLTAFGWNVVAYLGDTLATVVYVLVGLSAIYLVATHGKDCRWCMKGGMGGGMGT